MKGVNVAVVTGASSGLGKEIAKKLCIKGFKVYAVARSIEKLQDLKKECSTFSGKLEIISGDLMDSKFRHKLISGVIKKEKKIDYFVNNAGFGKAVRFSEMLEENIQAMNQLNVVAYQHLTLLVLKEMLKRNSGRIIHIGSVVAFTPLPYFTVYNSTKAAIYMFNRSLRYELKNTKVTSTVVLPARMSTGFAKNAFKKDTSVKNFNSGGVSPDYVANQIVKKIDSGKEVITPTFKAKLWYLMRYFGRMVDLVMKNILGPKQENELRKN